jgi:hypothetical protein
MSEPKIRLSQISPSVSGTDSISGNVTITNDLTVGGNLTVSGDTTTLNVQTLLVEDNEIILNSSVTGTPSLNASVTVNRGSSSDVFLLWNESTDKWGWSDDGNTVIEFSNTVLKTGDTMTGELNVANNLLVTGNVGIGTSADKKLDFDGGELRVGQQTSGSGAWLNVNLRDGTSALAAIRISERSSASSSEAIPVTQPHLLLTRGSDTLGTFIQFKNQRDGYAGIGSLATAANTHDIRLYTGSGTEKLRVDANGNVGIGTTSPAAKLSVDGSVIFNDSGADVDFRVEGDTDANLLFVDASTDRVGVGTDSPTVALDVYRTAYPEVRTRSASYTNTFGIDTVNGYGVLGSVTNNAFTFVTNNTERARIDASGNLGVGTTSPGSTLHVSGNTQIYAGNLGNTPPLIFGSETGAPKKAIFLENYWMIYQGHDNEGHKFRSVNALGAGTDDMVITGAGNVGIGTTSPQGTLHVRPPNNDTVATALFVEQYNTAGNDRALLSVQVDAANNFTILNSSGTNTGGYKFQCGNVERLRLDGSGNFFGTLDSHPEHEFFRSYSGELTGTNLNSLTDKRSGLYYAGPNFATNSNLPRANYFTLLNLRNPYSGITSASNSLDRAAQVFFGDTPNSMFVRYYQAATTGWHAWEQILTDKTPGSVIQVVANTSAASATISSTSFTATGVQVKITPRSANSKILVFGALHVYKSSGIHVVAKIYRDGTTDLVGGLGLGGSDNDGGSAHYDIPNFVLDSPATTSEVTYEFYAALRETGTFFVNDGGSYRSQLIAMEIVG